MRTRRLIRYHQHILRTTAMRTRFVSLGGAALLVTAVGFVAASAGSTGRAPGGQRSAAPAPPKPAAPSMVVYKSPT